MTSNARVYWLHAISPLHVGAGKGVGFIDMPVMRERVTGWPLVPGSAVKGVLRDDSDNGDPESKVAFGIASDAGETASSGSLVFTDAHLIALPIRSLYGTFGWITSPMVLRRLDRDYRSSGLSGAPEVPTGIGDKTIYVPNSELSALKDENDGAYLEDLDFTAQGDALASEWANLIAQSVFYKDTTWGPEFVKRFGVVSDESFNFLCEHCTEVSARIKINPDTKTVASGALWYEEYLPVETILAGIVLCDKVYKGAETSPKDLLDRYCTKELSLQMGGLSTLGKGRVRMTFGVSA